MKVFALGERDRAARAFSVHESETARFVGNAKVLAAVKETLDEASSELDGKPYQQPLVSPSGRRKSLSISTTKLDADERTSLCRVVSVDGESGYGKTRLVRELKTLHGKHWAAFETTADAVTGKKPYAVWFHLLQQMLLTRKNAEEAEAPPEARSLRAATVAPEERPSPRRRRSFGGSASKLPQETKEGGKLSAAAFVRDCVKTNH